MADNRGSGVQSAPAAGGTADAEARRKQLADWYAAHPESAPDAVAAAQNAAAAKDNAAAGLVSDIGSGNLTKLPGDVVDTAEQLTPGGIAAKAVGDNSIGKYTPLGMAANVGENLAHGDIKGAIGSTYPGLAADALSKAGAGALGGVIAGKPDPAASADLNAARAARQQLLTAPATRPAPVASPTTIAQTPGAVAGTADAAAQAGPVNVGSAPMATPAPQISSGTVNAAQIGPAATVTAAQVAPTANAQAGQATASNIDTAPQAEFRSGQQGLVQQLQDAAAGNGPSAAQAQLQKANDQAIQTQASLAAGAHGTSRLTQRLLGADNIADLQQKNAADSAILKAQETQTARGQLGTALEGARASDIGLATAGAQLKTDVSKTNAGLNTTVAVSNADREAARNMKDAELQQSAAQGNQAAINEIAQRQAELTTGATSLSQQLALEAAKSNQGATVQTSLADQQAKARMQELQAQIDSQQGIANAAQTNELQKLQAQLDTTASVANAGQAGDTARAQGQIDLQTKVQNLDAALRARGYDDAQRKAQLDAFVQSQGQILQADTSKYVADAGGKFTPKDIVNGFATGVAALSDQRTKRDVKPVDGDAVKNLASKLETIQWRYKGEHDDGKEHFGVMAQALEKDPLGAKLVSEGDDGLKRVDYQGLTALLLAAALKGKRVARGV